MYDNYFKSIPLPFPPNFLILRGSTIFYDFDNINSLNLPLPPNYICICDSTVSNDSSSLLDLNLPLPPGYVIQKINLT